MKVVTWMLLLRPMAYIHEPTHILPNLSSYIDLIFINQNNFIMDSSVHIYLHPNCHHQIGYAKLNSKIEYPQLYERLVWDYKNTNTHLHNLIIETFNWRNCLEIRILMSSYTSSIKPYLIFLMISFQIRI